MSQILFAYNIALVGNAPYVSAAPKLTLETLETRDATGLERLANMRGHGKKVQTQLSCLHDNLKRDLKVDLVKD